MRIAVIHNLQAGGAHRRLTSQLRHVHDEVIEICPSTATPIRRDAIVIPLQQRAPARSRVVRPPLRYVDLTMVERAWRQVAALIRASAADVVYANPCRYLQAPSAMLADGLPPTLYFCDEPRRVFSEETTRRSISRLTLPIYTPLYSRLARLDREATARADRLATNSRYTASEIERVYARSADVVTMGVADGLAPPPAEPTLGRRLLLSVGNLLASKGHDLVIQAAAAAQKPRPVVIVTPRPHPAEERRLRALATALGVTLDVRVGISDEELRDLYARAWATLYLAHREPLGLVALEAQAAGCPVIVSNEGGLPETIVDGVTGWQVPRNAAAAAAALDRLDGDAVHGRMSAAASVHARQWNWQASASELTRLLIEVADADRGSRSAVAALAIGGNHGR